MLYLYNFLKFSFSLSFVSKETNIQTLIDLEDICLALIVSKLVNKSQGYIEERVYLRTINLSNFQTDTNRFFKCN